MPGLLLTKKRAKKHVMISFLLLLLYFSMLNKMYFCLIIHLLPHLLWSLKRGFRLSKISPTIHQLNIITGVKLCKLHFILKCYKLIVTNVLGPSPTPKTFALKKTKNKKPPKNNNKKKQPSCMNRSEPILQVQSR